MTKHFNLLTNQFKLSFLAIPCAPLIVAISVAAANPPATKAPPRRVQKERSLPCPSRRTVRRSSWELLSELTTTKAGANQLALPLSKRCPDHLLPFRMGYRPSSSVE
jgi:hypothetical protein